MTNEIDGSSLPIAAYTVDIDGRLVWWNEAVDKLRGGAPDLELGQTRMGLLWLDGRPIDQAELPSSLAIQERRDIENIEVVVERPDGTQVPCLMFSRPVCDASGRISGATVVLVKLAVTSETELQAARLAAIVACSDDAIVSKSLDGRITSWNAGAAKIFGYEADEMIGRSIKTIIPIELHQEEDDILAKLAKGQHIDHFDTVRLTKDGRRVDVSLTVSPLRNKAGQIVGASKVARDITGRKKSEKLQRLLLGELSHRVKNTLATVQAIASQSRRTAKNPDHFVAGFEGRLGALARAHDLLVRTEWTGATLEDLIREQVLTESAGNRQISFSGPTVKLDSRLAVQLALVLHELTTNARKYGALSRPSGHVEIQWRHEKSENELHASWCESGVGAIESPGSRGFGSTLIERSLSACGGSADLSFTEDGLRCTIQCPLPDEETDYPSIQTMDTGEETAPATIEEKSLRLPGVRVLIVEDEPLIGMEIEDTLSHAGCQVVGVAGSLEEAHDYIRTTNCDIAFLDANLAGQPVDDIATALAGKQIPFAFTTGYGRDALPKEFQSRPLLAKPFSTVALLTTARELARICSACDLAE